MKAWPLAWHTRQVQGEKKLPRTKRSCNTFPQVNRDRIDKSFGIISRHCRGKRRNRAETGIDLGIICAAFDAHLENGVPPRGFLRPGNDSMWTIENYIYHRVVQCPMMNNNRFIRAAFSPNGMSREKKEDREVIVRCSLLPYQRNECT